MYKTLGWGAVNVEKRSGGRHLVGGGLREENGKVGEKMGKGMGKWGRRDGRK